MIAMLPRRHRSYRQSCAVLITSTISCSLFSSLLGMSSRLRCRARLAAASALLLLLGVAAMSAYAQNVTFAGAQTTVPATGLGYAFGVAVDAAGDVFISNSSFGQILEVTPGGLQTTILGSGLNFPQGIAVDGSGDVFIADSNNDRVVEVFPGGAQTTVGSGLGYTTGVAVDAAGDVFISDTGHSRVIEVPAGGGAQFTVGSGLYGPQGLTVDGLGDLFVATGTDQVWEVPAGGGAQFTVGSGFSIPIGVAVDGAGNVFISDFSTNLVWEVPAGGGAQFTVGSGFSSPVQLATDSQGDLFIADQGNNRIAELKLGAVNYGAVNVCPSGQSSPAPCSQTYSLTYNIAAGTTIGNVKILTGGTPNLDFQAEANDSSTTLCTAQTYASAATCTVDVTFAPLAPGLRMGAVTLLDNSGNVLATTPIQGTGQGPAIAFAPGVQSTLISGGGLSSPRDVTVDAAGDVFVVDSANNRVVEIPANGAQTTVGTGLNNPWGVAVDGAGDVFISDTGNSRVVKVTPGGLQTTVGSGLSSPRGVAVDGLGDLFIADFNLYQVFEVPAGGGSQFAVGSGMSGPEGVAVDGAGDLFIVDNPNNRVVEVPAGCSNAGCQITAVSGLSGPRGIAVDGAGDLFIGDTFSSRVLEVPAGCTSSSCQSTVGSGLGYPDGVGVDGVGDVFISDTNDGELLKVNRSQPPALTFATTNVGSTSSDSPQSVVVQNIGNQALNAVAPGLSVSGPNFAQVAGSGTPADCTSSFALTPGASCNLSLSFSPTSGGPLTGTAVFTDNALNASQAAQTISLSGTGNVILTQSITFTANAPAGAAYNTMFTVSATASSGLMVAFTSSGSCTNVGPTYTMTSGAGTCSVIANQAGNGSYLAAPTVTESVSASLASQTIGFTANAPASASYGSSFTVAATGGASGNSVTFTSSGACTNSGATYTMTSGTGTCSVIANQAGNNDYSAAPAVTESVSASLASQTITFTANAPASASYGSSFTVAATGGASGNAVTFTSSGSCTNAGATYTMSKATGTCSVIANQAGNGNYSAAPAVTESVSASLASQTITFTASAPASAANLSSFTVAATGGASGNAVTFSSSGACTNVGATYTMSKGTGTCSANANQAGNTNYAAATQVTQTVNATPAAQTITFTTPAPASAVYNSKFTVAASATSTLNVTFTSSGSCTNSGATYTMTSGAGTCSVIANQAGNSNYSAAPALTESVSATPASQTITFATNAPATALYNASFTVKATAGSGLAVAFSASGSCTISGATYTMTSGTGTCSVIANQAGNGNYSAAPTLTQNVSLTPASQTITFTTKAPASSVYNASFIVAAKGGASGNSVTFTSSGACTNSGATYTMTSGTGTCSVIANQAGNTDYSAAPALTESVSASLASQTITFTTKAPTSAVYLSTFTVVATGGASGDGVVFTSSGACSNVGATYTMTSSTGTCSVIANQGGNGNYSAAPAVTESVSAHLATQTITFTTSAPASAANLSSFTVAATGGASGNAVTFSSSGACTNVGATYTMSKGTGTCSVNANQAGNTNYAAATQVTQTVNATPAAQTITFSTPAPASAVYNSKFTVAASATSTLNVTFTSSGSCTNSGATYTMTSGTGTCSVIANQAGNSNYAAAPAVTQNVSLIPASQAITFTTNAPATAAYNASFTVVAKAGASGNAVTFTSSGVCTNVGATYTMTSGTGTCSVIANETGNGNYSAAPTVTVVVNATPAAQTITFTTAPPATIHEGPGKSTDFTVVAVASSGLPVTYTSSGFCSNFGGSYSASGVTTAETCQVIVNQAGNGNYAAAPALIQDVSVLPPPPKKVG